MAWRVGSSGADPRYRLGEGFGGPPPSGALAGRGGLPVGDGADIGIGEPVRVDRVRRTRRSRRSTFSTAPSGCGDPESQNRLRVPVPAWIGGRATTSEPRSRVMDRSAARAGGRPPSRSLQSPASTAPRQHREAAHGFHRRGDVGLASMSPEENEVALRMAAGGRRLRGGTGCRPRGRRFVRVDRETPPRPGAHAGLGAGAPTDRPPLGTSP